MLIQHISVTFYEPHPFRYCGPRRFQWSQLRRLARVSVGGAVKFLIIQVSLKMGKGYSFYFLAPCIVTIGFLISLIGVTSSDWIHLRNEDGVTVYENIWKYCWNDASTSDCTYFKIGQCMLIITVVVFLRVWPHQANPSRWDDGPGWLVVYNVGGL